MTDETMPCPWTCPRCKKRWYIDGSFIYLCPACIRTGPDATPRERAEADSQKPKLTQLIRAMAVAMKEDIDSYVEAEMERACRVDLKSPSPWPGIEYWLAATKPKEQ